MLDIFPSVETITSLNRFVREAVGPVEKDKTHTEDKAQNIKTDHQEEDIGKSVDIRI